MGQAQSQSSGGDCSGCDGSAGSSGGGFSMLLQHVNIEMVLI